MLRKVFVTAALLGLVGLTGCLTKPLASAETAVTAAVHPDGPVATFFGYGPWSKEFKDSFNRMETIQRSYLDNMDSMTDDFDKYFLNYDPNDPLSE